MAPYLYLQALQALTRKILPTPGLAIGLIRHGKVVFRKGFGLADISKSEKVTPGTIFDIASCTKSFTVLLAAMAVQEGRLDWDRPVVDYWPEFDLLDPYIARHVTARDMACHRTGMMRHDLAFFDADFSRQEFISRMKHLQFNAGFRTRGEYQNQVIVALGVLLEKIYGQSWEELVRAKIAAPLGIKLYFRGEEISAPYSKAYGLEKGKLVEIPYQTCSSDNPCGGIKLSLDGALAYLNGLLTGPFAPLTKELFKPHMPLDDSGLMPGEKTHAFGLGWMTTLYHGRRIVRHGGVINGFSSTLVLIPEERSAAVIFANTLTPALISILQYVAVDALLGRMKFNYPAMMKAYFARQEELRKRTSQQAVEKIACPLPLAALVGGYSDPGYGRATLEEDAGRLVFAIRKSRIPLEHVTGLVFRGVAPVTNAPVTVQFNQDLSGRTESVSLYTLNQPEVSCVMHREGVGTRG
jgi:CubicO group peptidase (beta-lactamase class C family)